MYTKRRHGGVCWISEEICLAARIEESNSSRIPYIPSHANILGKDMNDLLSAHPSYG